MLQLKVEAIKWETIDTATFFLSELSGEKIHYKSGQFITLVFNHHDEEIRRSYSLSSSPDENLLSITVKRIPNGEVSRFMLTKLKAGDILQAVEPAGRFTMANTDSEKNIFLFAAGSGIVPIYSQLKYALHHRGRSKFILVYSNQNAASILFRNELDTMATLYPERLKIIHLLSSETNRLNNLMVEQLVIDNLSSGIENAEFYLCGPFSYMRMVRLALLYTGIEQAQIHKENFVINTIQVAGDKTSYPPGKIKIIYRGESYDITTGENQSILQAALQNQIPLPYSCKAGICSTCMAWCKSGEVKMSLNDVLTDGELAQGWILTCTGHPVGNGVIISFDE